MPETRTTTTFGDGRTFSVTLGSILEEDVDALVNAANSHLAHGGGVAAVIAGAAGPALDEASRALVTERGPVPAGSAVVTPAGDLPHRGVIHAVGPRQGDGDEGETLASAVAAALDRAAERGWASVALPAISSGIFGVPYDVCSRAYVAGVRRHLEADRGSSVRDVRLCLSRPDDTLLAEVDRAVEERL